MRNAGAQNPTLSKEGIRPTARVATDISNIVSASTDFRPTRSPSGTQNNPPNGRTRKDIANVASANRETGRAPSTERVCTYEKIYGYDVSYKTKLTNTKNY